RSKRDWSSDVCSSDLGVMMGFENENLTPRLMLQANPTDNFQFETNLFAGFTKAKHGSGDDQKYPFSTWGFPSSFYEITDVEERKIGRASCRERRKDAG